MDICKTFGNRVCRLREKRGWSQEELAAKSGISRPHISHIERGTREPGLRTVHTLADTFELSLSALFRKL